MTKLSPIQTHSTGIPKYRLPNGLTLTPEGRISGYPLETGLFVFSVQVTEPGGDIKTKLLTLFIGDKN